MKLTQNILIEQHSEANKGYSGRFKINGKWYRRGLGTRDLEEAKEKATELYIELKGLAKHGYSLAIRGTTVGHFLDQLNYTDRHKELWRKRATEHLGKIPAKSLKLVHLDEYLKHWNFQSETPYNYAARVLRNMFYQAQLAEEMVIPPEIPTYKTLRDGKEKKVKTKRKAFSDYEIDLIHKMNDKVIEETKDSQQKEACILFHYYFELILETGMRSGEEAKKIKWGDIHKTDQKDEFNDKKYLEKIGLTDNSIFAVDVVNGKMKFQGGRLIPISAEAASVLSELANVQLDVPDKYRDRKLEYASRYHRNEYIWLNVDGKFPDVAGKLRQLKEKIEEQWKYVFEVQTTLYTARHRYITNQLKYNKNIDVYMLAKLMGNSVSMIEGHYEQIELIEAANELVNY